MSRLTTTTAIAVALGALHVFAAPAQAACTEGGDATNPTLTCTGSVAVPIVDARDDLSVTVESGAEITDTGRPVELTGSDQFLDNSGLIESVDDDAVRGKGENLRVDNAGTIRGGDRGIRLQDDADGFTLNNLATGEIFARRQAVRLDSGDKLKDPTITNFGLIESTEGRAIQSRGPGTTITNHGTLRGGEEVVEAREGFTLENHGTIAIRGLTWDATTRNWTKDDAVATDDEDGVQFAGGTVDNHGVILGTDDGIDVDEGTIRNHATGVIVTAGPDDDASKGGIDIDETFGPTVGDDRPAGPLTIINDGYIEGGRAIATDEASTSEITIENSGTLFGRSGTAIGLAPGQGDSSLTLSGDSEIFGDVLFGGGNDTLTIGAVGSGPLINSVFDGGAGNNTVLFSELILDAVTSARFGPDLVKLTLDDGADGLSGDFGNFGLWQFNDTEALTTAALRSALPGAVVVPLPAGLPLLLSALGGLLWMRRRGARA